jgi:hypothetical protein
MSALRLSEIESLAMQLDPADRRRLLERLAQSVQDAPHPPRDLYGVWRGKFPAEFDLDSALREIRSEWRQGRVA